MNDEKMQEQEQRSKNKFNSQKNTKSTKVQNQNDTHNSAKEGLGPNTKR